MLLPLLMLLACTADPPVDHTARRTAMRARLQAELGPDYDRALGIPDETTLYEGREIYFKSCVKCHGEALDGKGARAVQMDPRPAPLKGPGSDWFSPAAQLEIVRHGSPGTGMAPWSRSFTDAQIQAVMGWVRAMNTAE